MAKYSRLAIVAATIFILTLALPLTLRLLSPSIVRPPEGLVFISGNSLMTIAQDGSTQKLAEMPPTGSINNPAASPDGKYVVFSFSYGTYGQRDWGADLYLLQISRSPSSQSKPKMILRHERSGDVIKSASWKQDGRQLLVSYDKATYDKDGNYRGTKSYVKLLDLDTRRTNTLLANATDAVWSHKGDKIAYVKIDRSGKQSLWLLELASHRSKRITEDSLTLISNPRFSPDGQLLAFAASQGWPSQSRVIKRSLGFVPVAKAHVIPWDLWIWDGEGEPRRLTTIGQDLISEIWLPDNQTLFFITDLGAYQINAGGQDLRKIKLRATPRGITYISNPNE